MVSERASKSKTLKFLCSYSGKIMPRPIDGELRYFGGFTRILTVDRSISFAELMVKLGEFCGFSVILKCQLPRGELDTLITITSDEDLASLLQEYDRVSSSLPHPLKVRAVLWPPKSLKKISPSPSSAPCLSSNASKSSSKSAASNFSSRGCLHQNSQSQVRPMRNPAKFIAVDGSHTKYYQHHYGVENKPRARIMYSGAHCRQCHANKGIQTGRDRPMYT